MAAPTVPATYSSFQSDGGNDGKGITTGAASVTAGDYLVLCVGSSSNADTISPPATGTWEEITVADNLITTSGGQIRAYICKNPASSTAYNCTMSGGRRSAIGHLVRGAIAPPGAGSFLATVVDVKGSLESVAAANHAPPSLTTTGTDRLIIDFAMFRQFSPDVAQWSVPASGLTWTKAPSTDAQGLDSNNNIDLGSGYAVQSTAGAVSTTVWTNSDIFEPAMVLRLAIIPAAGGSDVTAADAAPPAAMRWRSTQETAVANGVSSDVSSPGAWRWRSSLTETAQSSVVSSDASAPGALRWRGSLVESGVVNVVGTDSLVVGFRWRSSLTEAGLVSLVTSDVVSLGWRWRDSLVTGDVATIGNDSLVNGLRWSSRAVDGAVIDVIAADTVVSGWRFRESLVTGDVATVAADTVVSGWRWRSRAVDGSAIDVTGADTQPLGWRVRDSQTAGSVSVVGTDTPNGLRWRASATGSIVNPPDVGTDVVGYDLIVLGWRFRDSLVVGYIGVPVTEEPDLFSVVVIDRFSSNVGERFSSDVGERFASVTVADRS
jgi:hypothetical protein